MNLAPDAHHSSVQALRPPPLERARGMVRLVIDAPHGRARLARLRQSGSLRVRLPRTARGAPVEVVLLNTAGGVTGGDRLRQEVAVGPGASAVVTTQAAERIYRAAAGSAEIETRIEVRGDGRLFWIPQETILFNGSSLSRRLVADFDGGATLLVVEAVVLGRLAMGERLTAVDFADHWRIRRDGRLVFADSTRLAGDAVSLMSGPATGGGATAFATLCFAAPDAEGLVGPARAALAHLPAEAGVSGFAGMLVARILAHRGRELRAAVVALVETLRGVPMPRVYNL
jgi:urease accessory protein